jgi:hypothetical protein
MTLRSRSLPIGRASAGEATERLRIDPEHALDTNTGLQWCILLLTVAATVIALASLAVGVGQLYAAVTTRPDVLIVPTHTPPRPIIGTGEPR